MAKTQTGSITLLFLPGIMSLFLLALFLSRWSRALYLSEKAGVTRIARCCEEMD
jgi:hypothetical protein